MSSCRKRKHSQVASVESSLVLHGTTDRVTRKKHQKQSNPSISMEKVTSTKGAPSTLQDAIGENKQSSNTEVASIKSAEFSVLQRSKGRGTRKKRKKQSDPSISLKKASFTIQAEIGGNKLSTSTKVASVKSVSFSVLHQVTWIKHQNKSDPSILVKEASSTVQDTIGENKPSSNTQVASVESVVFSDAQGTTDRVTRMKRPKQSDPSISMKKVVSPEEASSTVQDAVDGNKPLSNTRVASVESAASSVVQGLTDRVTRMKRPKLSDHCISAKEASSTVQDAIGENKPSSNTQVASVENVASLVLQSTDQVKRKKHPKQSDPSISVKKVMSTEEVSSTVQDAIDENNCSSSTQIAFVERVASSVVKGTKDRVKRKKRQKQSDPSISVKKVTSAEEASSTVQDVIEGNEPSSNAQIASVEGVASSVAQCSTNRVTRMKRPKQSDHSISVKEALSTVQDAVGEYKPSSNAQKEYKCSICQDTTNRKKMKHLPCTHGFHQLCIDTWLKDSSRCPLCREPTVTAGKVQRTSDSQLSTLEQFMIGSMYFINK